MRTYYGGVVGKPDSVRYFLAISRDDAVARYKRKYSLGEQGVVYPLAFQVGKRKFIRYRVAKMAANNSKHGREVTLEGCVPLEPMARKLAEFCDGMRHPSC